MNVANDNFRVVSHDDRGEPVRCSFCGRGGQRVVVLTLAGRPELEAQIRAIDSGELWLGLCAYCVLDMAKVLQKAEGKLP